MELGHALAAQYERLEKLELGVSSACLPYQVLARSPAATSVSATFPDAALSQVRSTATPMSQSSLVEASVRHLPRPARADSSSPLPPSSAARTRWTSGESR